MRCDNVGALAEGVWSLRDSTRGRIVAALGELGAVETADLRRGPKWSGEVLRRALPPPLVEELERFGRPGGRDALIVENAAAGSIGEGSAPAKWFLLGLLECAGLSPYSLVEEHEGALVPDVVPEPQWASRPTWSGRVAMPAHCHHANLTREARPEAMALLTIDNPGGVVTSIALLDDLLAALPTWANEVLRRPWFVVRSPESMGPQRWTGPRPVLAEGPDGRTEVSFSLFNGGVAPGAEDGALAEAAIFALNLALHGPGEPPMRHLRQRRGACLLVSNVRALIARGPVRGRLWACRAYGRRDLSSLGFVEVPARPFRYWGRGLSD